MSLTTTIAPTYRLLPAGDDPRLPAGYFYVSQDTAGDGTAGTHTMRVELAPSTHPRNMRIQFALGSLSLVSTVIASPPYFVEVTTGNLSIDAFNLTTTANAINQRRIVELELNQAANQVTGLLRDLNMQVPWDLGFAIDGSQSYFQAVFANPGAGGNSGISLYGLFWLGEAAVLPGGPQDKPVDVEQIQSPSYPVGRDSYYAKLRRGEQPKPVRRQAERIVAAVPQVQRSQARVGASDDQLINEIAGEVANTGASLRTAAARILGQSASQVVHQIADVQPGQTPPPGMRYANIGGRFEEGSGV